MVMHIKHEQLELQSYFMPQNRINVQLTKFIFHAKTRMLNVRHNFKNMFRDLSCPLGCGGDDTQEHILTCTKIVETTVTDGTQIKYEELFSDDILKQTACATILQRRYNIRKGMVWCLMSDVFPISLPWWTMLSVLEYLMYFVLFGLTIYNIMRWSLIYWRYLILKQLLLWGSLIVLSSSIMCIILWGCLYHVRKPATSSSSSSSHPATSSLSALSFEAASLCEVASLCEAACLCVWGSLFVCVRQPLCVRQLHNAKKAYSGVASFIEGVLSLIKISLLSGNFMLWWTHIFWGILIIFISLIIWGSYILWGSFTS